MTATSHAIIGAVIAAKIGNPALAIPLAVASHVAMDLVPHWDPGTHRRTKSRFRFFIESASDGILGLTLSYSIIVFLFPSTNYLYALLIMFFATLPDWLHAPYTILGIEQFKWAYDFGHLTNKKLDKPWGVVTQMVAVIIIVLLGKIL